MKWNLRHRLFSLALIALLICPAPLAALAEAPVVRAVLFYSPSCGHCHKVITEDLPPLFQKHGDQLQMIGVDASEPTGGALYNAAADKFNVPPEERGVPMLLVADVMLMGSAEIPERFPGLIEQYLAAGGVDWPDVPGMAEVVAQAKRVRSPRNQARRQRRPRPQAATPAEILRRCRTQTSSGASAATYSDCRPWAAHGGRRRRRTRSRSSIATYRQQNMVLVLVGMVAAPSGGSWQAALARWRSRTPVARSWQMGDAVASVGLGIAGYLAYVETNGYARRSVGRSASACGA